MELLRNTWGVILECLSYAWEVLVDIMPIFAGIVGSYSSGGCGIYGTMGLWLVIAEEDEDDEFFAKGVVKKETI